MKYIWNTFLYQPILSTLVFIYDKVAFGDFGLAVVILTIVIRIVLFPLFYKGAKQQAIIQKIQPKIRKIQKELKHDKEKQAAELMKIYKKHKINPFSSILTLLVQLPILIALYRVILNEIGGEFFDNFIFLGFIDLREKSIIIAVIAAILQYVQIRLAMPKKSTEKSSNPIASAGRMMAYIGPGLTLFILTRFPAALGIYWLTSTIFSIGQQIYINKRIKKEDVDEEIEELKEEAEEEVEKEEEKENKTKT